MTISKATKSDLSAIKYLISKYSNRIEFEDNYINKNDIALQARSDTGELIGFVWVGLMAKNSFGYIDCLVVDPEFKGNKIAQGLLKAMLLESKKRKINRIFGVIAQDEFHDSCAISALKAGSKFSTTIAYTMAGGFVDELMSRLMELES